MRDVFKILVRSLTEGQPACLVSLLSSSGSTPRGTGALMAVLPDGSIAGTIGGGNVEFEAQKLAAEVLRTGEDAVREYRFVQGNDRSLGMVCGGDVTVGFQYLSSGKDAVVSVFRSLLDADAQGKNAWLLRQIDGPQVTEMRAVTDGDAVDSQLSPLLRDLPVWAQDDSHWFSIPAVQAGWVHIFGAGHVSRALAAALHPLGFRCAVYDDRSEFADAAYFPTAKRVETCDFNRLQVTISPADYVVVMTRGHEADYEVLSQTLRSGARYLGCIGSSKKLALCKARLLNAGFTEAEYAPLHAPIGLSIGAQTPEEIAVSVAAELIAVRAGARS